MPAFKTIREITEWWKTSARGREVGVLFDCTDVGEGVQRREIFSDGTSWIIGFAREGR